MENKNTKKTKKNTDKYTPKDLSENNKSYEISQNLEQFASLVAMQGASKIPDYVGTRSGVSKKWSAFEKKIEKNKLREQKLLERIQKQNFAKVLEEDKLSKNVIQFRKNAKKKDLLKSKSNKRRAKRCNNYLLTKDEDFREIYFTIDKFNNNGKKTIVYFIDSFYPLIDGVIAVLDNYATHMQKYYNVVICAPKHKQTCFKTDKYFVLYSDSMYIKNQDYDLGFPGLDPVFQRYISLLKIDLIHIQAPFNMGSFGLSLAKKRKVPSITSFHSQFKLNFYNAVKNEVIATWLTKILMNVYQKSTVALTMNDFTRKIMKEYGVKRSVQILPNATNLKPKNFLESEEISVLEKHGINNNVFNMIFIGRFVEVKNVYFILDILVELSKRTRDFNFIFLGYGPEQGRMQKICKENGIENLIKFTGKIDSADEKAILIKNSDLLLFPSVYDTDGIVKIECACYGIPTLCIEDTGVASNMVDNHNAFIEKYTVDDFVKRIEFLLKNVEIVKKVGENAKKEIYITWEEVCERLKDIYEKCLRTYHLNNAKKNKNKTTKNI